MFPESFEFIKKNFVCKGKTGAVTKVKYKRKLKSLISFTLEL